jgi:hypothetical protein
MRVAGVLQERLLRRLAECPPQAQSQLRRDRTITLEQVGPTHVVQLSYGQFI